MNELKISITQEVPMYDEIPNVSGDSDEINLSVIFFRTREKHEITVYPDTTIQDIFDFFKIEGAYICINTRTRKQTNQQETTMAEFNILNNDELIIYDDIW